MRPETRPAVGRASWFEPIYPYYPWAYEVAVVLGRGKLAKIEVALSSRAEFKVKLLGGWLRRDGGCRGLDIRAATFVFRV